MIKADYEPRPIRFLDQWSIEGLRLKVYSIAHGRAVARDELIDAARRVIGEHLRDHRSRNEHYGVGFIGIHDGRSENQVFLDLWINQNELLHSYWISPMDAPAKLVRAGDDHNSVCVWDLRVQCAERESWIECVIGNPQGPDIEAYLARRLNADV